tara:strand:+ start:388 stop:654 length:267 start_codon:yes stop_codon:yes gene_type:complete
MSWRKDVDPILKEHLEALIKESYRYKRSYKNSKDVSKAQLWCALACLSKEIFDLNLKVKFLEKALQGAGKKKSVDEDVKKVMDSLGKF